MRNCIIITFIAYERTAMKKIFIMSNDMNGGGAEKVLLTLLRRIPRQGCQITLGLVYLRGPNLAGIPADIPVRHLFEADAHGVTARIKADAATLYEKIAPPDSDIEIAFLEGNATKIISASKNRKAKRLAWVHIDLSHFHYTKALYDSDWEEGQAYRAFDRLIFVSHGALSGFEALLGDGLRSRSVVQYNPIDSGEILRLSKEFPVSKRRLTLCASGRIVPQKGFDRLLAAVGRLQQDGLKFDLWILGDGPEREKLLSLARSLPEPDAISLLGFQENPYPYMRTADIFVCSSFVEGLSLVVGEALILNRRIVATNCCGISEALQGGKYGALVENSEHGLYSGLKQALEEPAISDTSDAPEERFAPFDMCRQMPAILKLLDLQ